MIKKILVPLDGSKLAECVLPLVEELALKLSAEVAFVSVTNRIQGYWPFEDASRPDEVRLDTSRHLYYGRTGGSISG